MIVPNKLVRYKESIIYKMMTIIEHRDNGNIKIADLYNKCKNKYNSVDEFIYSIEVLYILECINIDFIKGEVNYVKRDTKYGI